MRPLLFIIGAVVIGVMSCSAEARGVGGGHSAGRAHFGGNGFGIHHFGFNSEFNRFGFNRRFNGNFGWGYGDYGWGYGDYGYPDYAVAPNVVVVPQPPPVAAPAPERVGNLPPCHEVTPFGVTIDRGMGCSRGSG